MPSEEPLVLSQVRSPQDSTPIAAELRLTAEERTRTRHRFVTDTGRVVYLRLVRGTVLQHGDRLLDDTGTMAVRVAAKPEPVFTVTAKTPLDLLRIAYHLGNRHVHIEIACEYLRLSPDPVLKTLLEGFNAEVREEVVPFQPERGAYNHHR